MFGTGDDEQAALGRDVEVVRDEGVDLPLDDRMPAAADREARRSDEFRTREVERLRALGEGRQHVERGERRPHALQRGNRGREVRDQALVEQLFARERALLRRERAILERLQLRRDVALGVLERLPAPVVVGDLLHVGVGDLDVEAVHAVVLDLEVGDAGARALARLERDQELAAVVVDRAKLVELGVEAGRDDAAVADLRRRLRGDGARRAGRPTAGR